ncbi:helix-turn-helix domain-containing protein [Kribbella sp. NBC_00709]|uniref:IclR family transcriptional regulator n=1 Tax=Kribbella sp. NBC_00709 TaxID=2975972 RepID=UPI002E2894FD|nr:IclR family transcriptional regulator C-terminal domain-containing protein [Kribbella sp. NBC_00709]
MKPAQPNQSLIDGLACLQALAAHAQPVGSRELGRMLGLEPTRVNRLLKTLAFVGLAQQNEQRKYLPGPAIHVLAAQSMRGSGLIRRALEPLESLFDLELQVAMGVLWDDQVCYLYHHSPGESAGEGLGREPLYPAASSGLGQVLLAEWPDEQVRELYTDGHRLRGMSSPRTVGLDGDDGLLAQLAQVREQGYALTQTLESSGLRTLGVALKGDNAAIGVAGRFKDRDVARIHERVAEAARRIENADDAIHRP